MTTAVIRDDGPVLPVPGEVRLRPPAEAIRAERFDAALAARDWTIVPRGARTHALLLMAGRGHVRIGDGVLDLAAPCLAWLPSGPAQAIRVEAGARGHWLGVADDLVARTVADHPEALQLRRAADRILVVIADRADAIGHSFTAIEAETRQPQPGAFALLAAHLGLVLLQLWRLSGLAETASDRRGGGSVTLQRFRHLLELHYREHWPVAAYAAALGVTADHLQDACRRGAGAGPLALLQQRLVEEAKTRLAQTALPVEQVAFGLGFRDPAYFNRFFRARTGQPPGAWRRAAQQEGPRELDSFAAWP
jgi:AraC family transcriptional activator of pobA